MNLKFTVITVTYNAEAVIRKTIESVLSQKLSAYEYLIVDGKSKDKTLEIAKEYAAAFEQKGIRYCVFSEKDTGIYNAMNRGIEIATGEFISFLNAGDWYEKDALKDINDFYNEDSFDLTYGGLHYINPDKSITVKMSKLDKFLVTSRNWNHPSMFLRTEIYKGYKFDETFRIYADFHLYLKLRKSEIKIRVIEKIIANFPADGLSTEVRLKKVIERANEKYHAYRENGYARIYWFESYGWEFIKSAWFRLHS